MDMLDLKPLQDMSTDEDDEEATVRAMMDAEDPYEGFKQHLHCGGAYIEEIIDD